MKRIVDAKEFSDLRTFEANDMVRIACNECSDCSKCCRTVGDSIILDPYDIYCLEKGLKTDFTGLLNSGRIELRCVDGLIQPNLKIRDNGAGCSFLNDGGRCGIHSFRPGFCRLFPLGRIYDGNGGFRYFVQEDECPHPNKTKIKISQWLGIDDIVRYEKYVTVFHGIIKKFQREIEKTPEREQELNLLFLQKYYLFPFNTDRDFYSQFETGSAE